MGLHSSEPNQTKYKWLSKVIRNVFQSQYWFPIPALCFTLCSTTQRSVTFQSKHCNSAIFTALLDPTVYIYMLYLLRHKRRGGGGDSIINTGESCALWACRAEMRGWQSFLPQDEVLLKWSSHLSSHVFWSHQRIPLLPLRTSTCTRGWDQSSPLPL